MKAVLITGNKRYIKSDIAQAYYSEIVQFLQVNGIEVIVDPGEDYTCPPEADFYIAHSKGVGRFRCVQNTPKEKDFLMFGAPEGIIHPVDLEWQKANPPNGRYNPPLDEHYIFMPAQKQAILNKIAQLQPTSLFTRQDPLRGRPRPHG